MKKSLLERRGVSLVLSVCLTLLLTACSRPAKQTYTPQTPTQTQPTAAQTQAISQAEATALLEDLLALPEESLAEIETSDSAKMQYLLNQKTTCSIESIGEDTMELCITTPDMRELFLEQTDENADNTDPVAESARIMEAVLTRMEATDCPIVTNHVTAELDLSGETPQIVVTKELADAIYGNLLTLFDELMNK